MQGAAVYSDVTKDDVARLLEEEVPVDAKGMARQLGCAASTVGRMGAAGLIPSILLGSREGSRRYFPALVKRTLMELSHGRVI